MPRPARRVPRAPQLETLEPRTLLSLGTAVGPVPWTPPRADAAASILLRFSATTPAAAVATDIAQAGGSVVETFPAGPTWVVLNPTVNLNTALARLRADPGIVYAEADATFHVNTAAYPTDPLFSQQWGLNNPDNVDIDAPEAWGVTIGSRSTIVAVLDTGIDLFSPEFGGRIWTNPNPYGDPGFYDDVNGWNFVNNNNNVYDNDSHGTHVSGIIAAWSNNGVGVSGVDWNAQIMPVKVLDQNGNGSTDAAVAGIYYAVNHGARVINASWGGGAYSQAMLDAINYANSRGVVFVTAAGNDGTNNDFSPSYPASYNLPNEIAVAAIDQWGNLASFSNSGVNSVAIAAPGVNILSTVPGGYAVYSGTSMATPYVTGVVSLLVGLHPTWTAAQLVQQVLATAKPLPTLAGLVSTGGMVDAYNAVANIYTTGAAPPGTGGVTIAAAGGPNGLLPGASLDGDVLASLLSTDAYYQLAGGNNAGYVNGLFWGILGRPVDPASLSYFTNLLQSGVSRFSVAQTLVNTPEGRLVQVARWYQEYFGYNQPLWQLEANPSVQFWANVIATSGQNTALADILGSDPYWSTAGGNVGGFLNGVFWVVLGRPIDVASFWYFNNLLASGVSRTQVVRILQGTPEAKDTLAASWIAFNYNWVAPLATLKANGVVDYWAGFLGNT